MAQRFLSRHSAATSSRRRHANGVSSAKLRERRARIVEQRRHADFRDAVTIPNRIGGDEHAGHHAVGDRVAQMRAALVEQPRCRR